MNIDLGDPDGSTVEQRDRTTFFFFFFRGENDRAFVKNEGRLKNYNGIKIGYSSFSD